MTKYPFSVQFSPEDEGFIAVATDLPGCTAFGDTAEEALAELSHAIAAWIAAAQAAGNPVPAPSFYQPQPIKSGKFVIRLGSDLHVRADAAALREAKSLNQFVVAAIEARLEMKSVVDTLERAIEKALSTRLPKVEHFSNVAVSSGVSETFVAENKAAPLHTPLLEFQTAANPGLEKRQ